MDTFLASIMLWPCNFAPNGWAFCAGQLLSIAQNSALFSLLGTTYGGDGITTFGLPDLRGRVPVGAGQHPGGSNFVLGQIAGEEGVTLLSTQIPAHVHPLVNKASDGQATDSVPTISVNTIAAANDSSSGDAINGFNNAAPNISLNTGGNTGPAGGGLPHDNMQPYLAVNYIIALVGIYPSRS